MRYLKTVLFTLTLFSATVAQIDTNSQHYYMFVYFYNIQQEVGARLAFSTDAVNWEKYNDEKPIIVPKIVDAEKPLMRDPNILYDSSTGVFHLTWTTGWTQKNVGYATSKDLINWSEQTKVYVGKRIDGCTVCWAPEFVYNKSRDSVMLYWSTQKGLGPFQPFYCMTQDFKHYTEPKALISPSPKNSDGVEYSMIDASILKVADDKYYLFLKDERKSADEAIQNIHFTYGSTPQGPWWIGPWNDISEPITDPGFEGPTAIIIGDTVRLYADPFLKPTRTDRSFKIPLASLQGASAPPTTAWKKGQVMKTPSGDFTPNHGSISEIPRAKFMQIMYGHKDQTVYSKSWTDISESQIYFGNDPPPKDTATGPVTPTKEYPMGKQNTGCGTGVGLAFIPPIFFKGMAIRRRRKQNGKAKQALYTE